jgi:hypothetical protein
MPSHPAALDGLQSLFTAILLTFMLISHPRHSPRPWVKGKLEAGLPLIYESHRPAFGPRLGEGGCYTDKLLIFFVEAAIYHPFGRLRMVDAMRPIPTGPSRVRR